MARLLLLLLVLALLPDGMAYNPQQCTACPTPVEFTAKIEPSPTYVVTNTPTVIPDTPVAPTATPEPTEEPPSVCIQECKAACKEAGLKWKYCKDDCACLGGE